MTRRYASVNFGLEEIAAEMLVKHGAVDIQILDSAVLFSCENAPDGHVAADMRGVNNLYEIITAYRSRSVTEAAEVLIEKAFVKKNIKFPSIGGKTFRIVVMDCGKLCPLPAQLMRQLELLVTKKTNLTPHRANPDTEIWLLRRNTGDTFFMVRAKKHAAFDKTLKKGELRPDIADCMVHAANINDSSIVADLFGGWGAIGLAVVRAGQYGKILMGDVSETCVSEQKRRLCKMKNCIIQQWDGVNTPLKDASIDAVITDPPWGAFESIDTPVFYDAFIKEAARILRRGGSLVFLTSAREEARQALERYGFSYALIPTKIGGKGAFLFRAGI